MRKSISQLFVILVLVAGSVLTSNAQELGIRFGGTNSHGGAAVDAVFGAGEFSRIHADFGIYEGGVGIDALWDFIYKPLDDEAFNWYLGAGPSTYIGDDFWLGVSGEVGIEYHFSGAPIAMGVDWRPTFWIIDETSFGAGSFGFNVRYVFGK